MAILKRQLRLIDVFSIAAGAMISSGLFILPAIAFARAGPAMIVSYFLASVLFLPSILSKAELATAMPRAGGTYFFVERSLGSLWGVFSGLADWFSLSLKSAFAIVGMAILIEITLEVIFSISFSPWLLKLISCLCCLAFTALNVVSVKHTSRFQTVLTCLLLALLALFVLLGCRSVEAARFSPFMGKGWLAMIATTGMVFVSFGGVTKATTVAEEVRHPGRDLPLGMILAWCVVSIFYLVVIIVTVGVLEKEELMGSFLPISLAADKFMGSAGFALLALAATAAFITTANGGILAASRSPLAMSRDRLLPSFLSHVNERFKTPHVSIILTGGFIVTAIICLNIESLVKTASTLMILLFILDNASVIIMRESRIQSYRPKFRSPFYPFIHITAIAIYIILIIDMGKIPLLISASFVVISFAWYFFYSSRHVVRAAAVMHIVERVTDKALKTVTLENELRDILLERDDIIEDRFDRLIRECIILDIPEERPAQDVFRELAGILAEHLKMDERVLYEKFLEREAEGSTVIQPGFAIPHIIVDGEKKFDVLLVRARAGITFPHAPEPVKIMFVLVGSKDERNYHLRALMAIAQVAQEKEFEKRWRDARDTESIRNLILLSTRRRDTNV
ncbi:MAG: amino acid permease [Sedimentisphaerales bacterium]|nr:amino acid permease [Sedimentisphaerales bacterium]